MWMLIFFGMLIGLLAAVSEAAVTATLIGLLFALIGGSLVGWYRGVASGTATTAGATADARLTEEQVRSVAIAAGYIAIGGVLGMLLGFGLKTVDLLAIRPHVPLTQREKEIDKLSEQISDIQGKLANAPPGGVPAAEFAKLQRTLTDINAKIEKLPAEVKLSPIVVKTQSADVNQLRKLSTDLHKDSVARGEASRNEADPTKKKVFEDEAMALENLSRSVRELADALDNVNKSTPGGRAALPTEAARAEFDRIIQGK